MINNRGIGLLRQRRSEAVDLHARGPPTPDDMDELLALVNRGDSSWHPRAIAAFGRNVTAVASIRFRRTWAVTRLQWRGVPIFRAARFRFRFATSSIYADANG